MRENIAGRKNKARNAHTREPKLAVTANSRVCLIEVVRSAEERAGLGQAGVDGGDRDLIDHHVEVEVRLHHIPS